MGVKSKERQIDLSIDCNVQETLVSLTEEVQKRGRTVPVKNKIVVLTYDLAIQSWAQIQRKTYLKRKQPPQCSLQHCLQQQRYGSKIIVHQQMNG